MGNTFILPSTHPGSPRSQQKLYEDAMSIVQRFGRPHLFITLTTNPKWREIEEACTYYADGFSTATPGQRKMLQPASDRPDIGARVFDLKKNHLLKKIRGTLTGGFTSMLTALRFRWFLRKSRCRRPRDRVAEARPTPHASSGDPSSG